MKLYIGNKNYSSWSFRPWIGMRSKEIDFEEHLIPFDDDAGNPEFKKFSPTGKVPILVDGGLTVWESLAILEYLADKYPDHGFWPKDMRDRAMARAISSEMHSGFNALRSECPMNLRRKPKAIKVSDGVMKDVQRIEQLWDQCLTKSGGPYLFGEFSNADAMYAPVVNRLETFMLSEAVSFRAYAKSMKANPAWMYWEKDALQESWIVPADEVD